MASVSARRPAGNVRWGIGLLLGSGILINYIDRVNLSVALPSLQHDFGITVEQFGLLSSAFFYSFYLFLTWLPGYLIKTQHWDVLKSAGYTAIPWAFATVTDLVVGGWLVDYLVARGLDQTRVRKTLLVIGMLMGLAIVGATTTADANIAILYISIALGGLAFAAPIVTGYIVGATNSFTNAFLAAAVVLAVGIVSYVWILGRIEPIPEPAAT